MKRQKKAAIRARLVARLETAFSNIYHNATLGYATLPADAEDFLDDEAQSEELSFYFYCILDDINAKRQDGTYYRDASYIADHIAADYGPVHTYGRGGRTCAPSSWIRRCGGSSFAIDAPECEEMSRADILALLRDVEEWNAYVAAECASKNIQHVLTEAYKRRKDDAIEEKKAEIEALRDSVAI